MFIWGHALYVNGREARPSQASNHCTFYVKGGVRVRDVLYFGLKLLQRKERWEMVWVEVQQVLTWAECQVRREQVQSRQQVVGSVGAVIRFPHPPACGIVLEDEQAGVGESSRRRTMTVASKYPTFTNMKQKTLAAPSLHVPAAQTHRCFASKFSLSKLSTHVGKLHLTYYISTPVISISTDSI